MIKKFKIDKTDMFLILLCLINLILFIYPETNPLIKFRLYNFCVEHHILKSATFSNVYVEDNFSICNLTKEALSSKEKCLKNDGAWLYNSKTCICRPKRII